MYLGHDTEHAIAVVTELVNTELPDIKGLRSFVETFEISGVTKLTEADLQAVRELREKFHAVFVAPDAPAAAGLLNGIMAEARTMPTLTDHGGFPWHLHYFAPGASLAEHLAADCGMALARVVAEGEVDRLRTCEAPDCERVLLDLSKNRCRRYCDSRTCGNRLHVAAYRARRRAAVAM